MTTCKTPWCWQWSVPRNALVSRRASAAALPEEHPPIAGHRSHSHTRWMARSPVVRSHRALRCMAAGRFSIGA